MRNISISLGCSLAYFFSSFFVNIIPCQMAPNVPNPIYSWALCNINPDQISSFGIQKLYFGITTKLAETYFISLVLIFAIFMIILSLFFRKSKKIKDE